MHINPEAISVETACLNILIYITYIINHKMSRIWEDYQDQFNIEFVSYMNYWTAPWLMISKDTFIFLDQPSSLISVSVFDV